MIRVVVLCVFLGMMGWEDMRTRKVALWKILVFMAVGILISEIKDGKEAWNSGWGNVFISLMPGLFLLLAGRISGWAAGPADGLIVMGMGVYLGLSGVLDVLLFSCLLTTLAAGYLVIFRKKNKTYPIPFVPFLLTGTVGYLIWGQAEGLVQSGFREVIQWRQLL